MAGVIIGIHGLANKPETNIESQWWEASIREGLAKNCGVHHADFQYIMVYWADLLYKYPQHQDQKFDFDPLYVNDPYVEAAPGALKKYQEGWLDVARTTVSGAVGSAIDTVIRATGRDRIGEWLIEQKLRDLYYYYDPNRQIPGRDGQRDQARRVLMNELMSTLVPLKGERLMLIAHSMGTIIAYDVLRDLGQREPSFPVHRFVTIGSPLGLPYVKAKIYSERSYASVPVRTPTVVRERWVNYADRRDPVAVDTHLRDDFGPNDSNIRVEDDLIINDYVTPAGESKPHKSFGYLRTPELSEHIRDFLQSS